MNSPVIYMIGDSTMADMPVVPAHPGRGWGQLLKDYVKEEKALSNCARSGHSSKSFLETGCWQPVYDRIKPNDFVIIQFGHNDQKREDSKRYTKPEGDYRENLLRYIDQTRRKGGFPILATPICRRRFNENGEFCDTHADYPDVVRTLARSHEVPLTDLHHHSKLLIQEAGVEMSKRIFLWIAPGEYESLPEGKQDDTHLSEHGARMICILALGDLRRLDLQLVELLRAS